MVGFVKIKPFQSYDSEITQYETIEMSSMATNLLAEIVTWAVPGEVLGHLDGPPQDLLQFRRTFRKHSIRKTNR